CSSTYRAQATARTMSQRVSADHGLTQTRRSPEKPGRFIPYEVRPTVAHKSGDLATHASRPSDLVIRSSSLGEDRLQVNLFARGKLKVKCMLYVVEVFHHQGGGAL